MRNGLIAAGIASPNVGVGTEAFIKATAIGQLGSSIQAANSVAATNALPTTAVGTSLDASVAALGMVRLIPGPSTGSIVLKCASSSLVATDAELISSSGLRFAVSVGGTFANGASIQIVGIDEGTQTNLPESTVLTWTAAPPGSSATAIVGVGGLTDGVDAETDNDLLSRFIAFCTEPPGNGNAVHVNAIAEASTPGIVSYCYPGFNGPATLKVVVARAPTATNKGRDVDSLLLSGTIVPAIIGNYPEHCDISISTVANVNCSIALGLSLSENQWLDAVRFPSSTTGITSVTSSTEFIVTSTVAPSPGITHVAFLSHTDWTLYRAKVLTSVYGGSNLYTVTIDQPFPNVVAGDIVFPDCANAQNYCDAVLEYFADLGPGEQTSVAGLLPRALRRPKPGVSHPSTVTFNINKRLTNFSEVQDSQTLTASPTAPAVPALLTTAPNVLVPYRVGFFELV
jgi:hypothetical protein